MSRTCALLGARWLVLIGGPSPGGARSLGREARGGRILDVFNRRATKRTGPAARQRRREPFNTSLLEQSSAAPRLIEIVKKETMCIRFSAIERGLVQNGVRSRLND